MVAPLPLLHYISLADTFEFNHSKCAYIFTLLHILVYRTSIKNGAFIMTEIRLQLNYRITIKISNRYLSIQNIINFFSIVKFHYNLLQNHQFRKCQVCLHGYQFNGIGKVLFIEQIEKREL